MHIIFFLGGQTISSVFGFKFGNAVDYLNDKKKAEIRNNFSQLKVLIIDEVSMVGADLLYRIHLRLSDAFQTNPKLVPFGGINVVLVGDLLQLPPVKGIPVFSTPNLSQFEGMENVKPLWHEFKPMILKHNHRQGEDKTWAESLNRFREGIVLDEDVEVLKSRQIATPLLDQTCTHIFYYNEGVVSHNKKMLNSLDGELVEVKATQALPKGCKSVIHSTKGTIGQSDFQETVRLKVGARVMLVYNLDLMDDMYNGASGEVIGIEKDKKGQVYCIIVRFEEESVGVQHKVKLFLKYPPLKAKYEKQNGTPILKHELKFQLAKKTPGWKGAAEGKLLQFPLTTNYAQTSHKMQVSKHFNVQNIYICVFIII